MNNNKSGNVWNGNLLSFLILYIYIYIYIYRFLILCVGSNSMIHPLSRILISKPYAKILVEKGGVIGILNFIKKYSIFLSC